MNFDSIRVNQERDLIKSGMHFNASGRIEKVVVNRSVFFQRPLISQQAFRECYRKNIGASSRDHSAALGIGNVFPLSTLARHRFVEVRHPADKIRRPGQIDLVWNDGIASDPQISDTTARSSPVSDRYPGIRVLRNGRGANRQTINVNSALFVAYDRSIVDPRTKLYLRKIKRFESTARAKSPDFQLLSIVSWANKRTDHHDLRASEIRCSQITFHFVLT